jgi:hypothetical protein
MAKDFRHYCQVSHPKPGEVWAVRCRIRNPAKSGPGQAPMGKG